MLLKDDMAKKTAKFLVDTVVKDNKDNNLKERAMGAIEKAYAAGYDLAVQECNKDNSKSGDQMFEYLSTLEVPNDKTI